MPSFAPTVSPFIPDVQSAVKPVIPADTPYYEVTSKPLEHFFHTDMKTPAKLWGYNGVYPGPTLKGANGKMSVVRFNNALPTNDPVEIGLPINVIHRHGGVQAPEDDGYPLDFFNPGTYRDYVWPHVEETTMWYHDHSIDITAENVYRGLAGFYLVFDEKDSELGEIDPNSSAFRLPGRPSPDGKSRLYDIPLCFQDRQFSSTGQLVYDSFDHDGFIGDKFVVNGKIQPFFNVEPRKYRFRLLNGANARQFEFVLSDGKKDFAFDYVIGSDDHLFEAPIANVQNIRIAPAERYDVVIDFRKFATATKPVEVFLVNRLTQTEGRKPDKVERPGVQIMKFIVAPTQGAAADPSRIPATLRPIPAANKPAAVLARGVRTRRTFKFGRSGGAWVINGELYDENRITAQSVLDEWEIWTIESGGGWEHPVHIHLSPFYIINRDKGPFPAIEKQRKDTVVVGGDRGDAQILIRFENYTGRYVFHCHTTEHEDARMMANFEVLPKRGV